MGKANIWLVGHYWGPQLELSTADVFIDTICLCKFLDSNTLPPQRGPQPPSPLHRNLEDADCWLELGHQDSLCCIGMGVQKTPQRRGQKWDKVKGRVQEPLGAQIFLGNLRSVCLSVLSTYNSLLSEPFPFPHHAGNPG